VRDDTLRQSRQGHPGGGILCARRHYHSSRSMSASHRSFTVSSRCVGLLFLTNTQGLKANCDHPSECVHWPHACIRIAMQWGYAVKLSPRVPSTCVQNAILSLPIMHFIPRRQIYVAIDNPSLLPPICCLTTSSYLRNHMLAANDVSHAENLQSNSRWCFSHLNTFRDVIKVTRVFRYCGEHQGKPVQNESSIVVREIDFEYSLLLPWQTTIQRTITSPCALLYAEPVDPSVPSVSALAS